MLQPPAHLVFFLRFVYIGKNLIPRDLVSECSWGTLAVLGPKIRGTNCQNLIPVDIHWKNPTTLSGNV